MAIGLGELDIDNIFLYIGDAVRWDYAPDRLLTGGASINTVSSSIHTPSSFSSIFSGDYLPQHGVTQFGQSLPSGMESLFDIPEINTYFSNTINDHFNTKPKSKSLIHETLNISSNKHDDISEIEPPFLYVERGAGGHAPYGDFEGNAWEYFEERGNSALSVFRDEYSKSINYDLNWFEQQKKRLADRDLLDDTLIIYTSDHGELLGEEGVLGHNSPIHPKLVYVPTVFIHDDIENEDISNRVMRHVDLFPTIASMYDYSVKPSPGRDLTSEQFSEQGACFYSKRFNTPTRYLPDGYLSYNSMWDPHGGHVFADSTRRQRIIVLLGQLVRSCKRKFMRKHITDNFLFYVQQDHSYHSPKLSASEAQSLIDEIIDLDGESVVPSRLEAELDEQQLQNLGYLE